MRGIEAAFWGVLGQAPELKTSATGKKFCAFGCAVTVGKADNRKDVSQWVRVACFGDMAETLVARAGKGDRIYCEGTLTMTQWNDSAGEVRHGLNLAAWKCERVANIGKHREKKPGTYQDNGHSQPGRTSEVPASYCAGPAEQRPHSNADGFDFDRGDRLAF